jgi:hypothetical protein
MGSSGASGRKKRAKSYNDDGGAMSLKKAHKRARRKKKARRKRRRKRKKREKRKKRNRARRGRGGVKVDAKVMPQDIQDGPPEDYGDDQGFTWIEGKLIEMEQEDESVRNMMADTLGPTSDWLKLIANEDKNPYLAHLHQNIPSEAGAVMGAAAATPGMQDDLPIGVGIGLTFLAYHTITYFGKKARRPPRFKVAERQKNLPQKSTLQQHPPEHEPREPRDDDKTVKGLTDVIGKIMESEKVSLGAKILTGILSTIYVAQVAIGEKSKKDNKSSIEFAQTQLASHLTPIPSTSTIHTRLPTENIAPAPTQTSTMNIEPSSEATDQPTPSPTKTPRPSEERDEKRYPPGMTKE